MPAIKVDENELVKLELSATAAARACELTGASVASRILPSYPKVPQGSVGMPSICRDVMLVSCGHIQHRGDDCSAKEIRTSLPPIKCAAANAMQSLSQGTTALHVESKTKEIMSLPCTVVCSANGVRDILDLTYALT